MQKQDATDNLFPENEAAAALREIRARDPAFDMVAFLRNVRADVPMLLKVRAQRSAASLARPGMPGAWG